MTKFETPDVTVVSGKGQVVIPQSVRKKLRIKPKTRLLIYGYRDIVIMKKMEIPNVIKDLKALYRKIGRRIVKYGELSDTEINEIVQKYREQRKGEPSHSTGK